MNHNIISMGLIVAILVLGGLLWKSHGDLEDQQVAIINALGAAGIVEVAEDGEIIVNRVVRVKDLQE